MNTSGSIRAEVEEALMNDERTQDAVIDVVSDQGFVTLLGEVESGEIAQAVEEIADNQEGVIKVVNSLVVKDRS